LIKTLCLLLSLASFLIQERFWFSWFLSSLCLLPPTLLPTSMTRRQYFPTRCPLRRLQSWPGSVFFFKDWTKNGISFLTPSPDSGNSLEHSVEENPRFFRPNFQVLRNKIWSIKRSANPWSYFLRPHFSELGKFWCRKPILGQ